MKAGNHEQGGRAMEAAAIAPAQVPPCVWSPRRERVGALALL